MNSFLRYSLCLFLLLAAGKSFTQRLGSPAGASLGDPVNFTVLQINDVYEIGPLDNGKSGGMARVATLKKKLLAENLNTVLMLPGDFLNPSAMGMVKINGTKFLGKQMVDVMNRTGVDLVTFGNHEFDLDSASLQSRMKESTAQWITANVSWLPGNNKDAARRITRWNNGQREALPEYAIRKFYSNSADELSVGIISVTLQDNMPGYVSISDPIESAKRVYNMIKDSVDFVIAVTHLELEQDMKLAEAVPGLALIMGGHEHIRSRTQVGKVLITKADANAKSAWVHRFSWSETQRIWSLNSEIVDLNESIEPDAGVTKAVERWTKLMYDGLAKDGFSASEVVCVRKDTLDGRESTSRSKPTNLGRMIAASMQACYPDAQAGILNSGSIRLDDEVTGALTQYDIIRILPYGGPVVKVTMRGELLLKVLDLGMSESLYGNGGFLQLSGLEKGKKGWTIGGKPIKSTADYVFACGDYFITKENAYKSLWEQYKDMFKIEQPTTDTAKDVRKAFIAYLRNN